LAVWWGPLWGMWAGPRCLDPSTFPHWHRPHKPPETERPPPAHQPGATPPPTEGTHPPPPSLTHDPSHLAGGLCATVRKLNRTMTRAGHPPYDRNSQTHHNQEIRLKSTKLLRNYFPFLKDSCDFFFRHTFCVRTFVMQICPLPHCTRGRVF